MLSREEWSIPKVQPADVFSLESLIAWLEKQPGDGEYNFCRVGECLLAQWVLSIDPNSPLPTGQETEGSAYEYIVHGIAVDLEQFKDIACPDMEGETFSAALSRAKRALAIRDGREA